MDRALTTRQTTGHPMLVVGLQQANYLCHNNMQRTLLALPG